jgi:L-lactate dehydrogenase (cytochrome)/(S)-mandelate dehydrogenase
VDTPVRGNREAERETGMGLPVTFTPASILGAAAKPHWLLDLWRHKRVAAIHYAQSGATSVSAAMASAAAQDRHMQGDLCWDDLAWLRDQWRGPLYVKGVLDPHDAARAVNEIGAQGVVVSNHGGRQLDRSRATLDALPAIVARIAGRGEVYLDGGIRRGTDVIIALALGASGVFIGRPYVYGAAADGERGVAGVLAILRDDMTRAMTLMGCKDIAQLDRSWIIPSDGASPPPPDKEF